MVNGAAWLYRTDGTRLGTAPVVSLPNNSFPNAMMGMAGSVYFAVIGSSGNGLWYSDGTAAGTRMLKQSGVESNAMGREEMAAIGSTLYFIAFDTTREVWKTDGTPAGTVQVSNLYPEVDASDPNHLTAFGDRLYFFARTQAISGYQLWVTDGSRGGTQMLQDTSIMGNSMIEEQEMVANGTHLFLAVPTPCIGWELQSIDTPGGSLRMVKSINEDPASLRVLSGKGFAEYKGKTYFFANDFIHGLELWESDGTTAGTKIFMDINPTGSADNYTYNRLQVAGDLLYFSLSTPLVYQQWRLWKTDGTQAGTQPVRSASGTLDGNLTNPVAFQNSLVLFRERDGGAELWRTDGTQAGTKLLDTLPAAADGVVFKGKLYFLLRTSYSLELWETDGSVGGAHRVRWIYSRFYRSHIPSLVPFGQKLYFCGFGYWNDWALWSTDGTDAGTSMLEEIENWNGDDCTIQSGPTNLFILPSEWERRYQILKLNDAKDGFTTLRTADRSLKSVSIVGDRLYFRDSSPGSSDQALWTSDGTTAGTLELLSDSGPVRPLWDQMAAGNEFFFVAEEAASGQELWTTDGTKEGTHLAADVWPGAKSSFPFFYGSDSKHLWFLAYGEQTTSRSYSVFVYDLKYSPTPEPTSEPSPEPEPTQAPTSEPSPEPSPVPDKKLIYLPFIRK